MSKVKRRTVLYLSGFDPRGSRHYHQLFRAEATKQGLVSSYRVSVSKRERIDDHLLRWNVHFDRDGETVETEYLFCEWDDIIRNFWIKSPTRLAWVTLTASWRAFASGVFRKTFQWSWPAGVTATMPAILIFTLFTLITLLAGFSWIFFGAGGLLAGIAAGVLLFWLAYKLEQKFNLTWVGRILSFHEREEQSRTNMLDDRRNYFGQLLREKLSAPDVDEVLVVGHSYGAILAIATVVRGFGVAESSEAKLSLLTLGQTIMWLAWLPGSKTIRTEIAAVAESDMVDWIDFSAPPDGACFALVDPYTAIGDRNPSRRNPKLLNAKFHEIMPEGKFDKRRRNWMDLHFQYIMATVQPSDFDFFAIVTGPRTLDSRYEHRRSVRDFTRLRSRKMKAVR